ncbi:MAG: DUF1800 family protein [Pseudolabrys sp.]|nr:DUF1800 family protein [Pseudolabrys sp.]
MAIDPKIQAAILLHRFGFAPKAGGLAAFSRDPRAALLAELERPNAGQIVNDDLLSTGEAARATYDFRQERKAERLARRAEAEADKVAANAAKNAAAMPPAPDAKPDMAAPQMANAKPKQQPGVPQQIFLEEARARLDSALNADIGFADRLVWFWSNHFCVSADKGQVRALCGAFEREAIRPYITGKFGDMLMAVETHPAMLFYLDNARSLGPRSMAGQRRGKGLNENLAREILELHTLGVRTGYSQADVTSFAKVITGWSIVPLKQPENGGEFVFNSRMHEPGAQRVIDRDYDDRGVEQGRAVLARLAVHPATAKHIATKLARHFVADAPPQSLVDRLAKRFLASGGDLKQVSEELVVAPEAWDAPRTKMRKPSEWLVGALRATGISPSDVRPLIQAQNLLGEPLWRPPAPNGFSDDSAAWMDGLAQRLDIANQFARRTGDLIDPQAVAEASFGPLLSKDTQQTLARAESRQQAVALLLMSPEMQRR